MSDSLHFHYAVINDKVNLSVGLGLFLHYFCLISLITVVAITTEAQKAQQLILWPGAHWVLGPCSQLSIWHLLWCISKVPQILLFRMNSCKAHLWSLLLLFHLLSTSPTGRGWNHSIFFQTFMFHWMSAPFICLWEMSSISLSHLHIQSIPHLVHLTSPVACASGHLLLPRWLQLPHSWSFHTCLWPFAVHWWFKRH